MDSGNYKNNRFAPQYSSNITNGQAKPSLFSHVVSSATTNSNAAPVFPKIGRNFSVASIDYSQDSSNQTQSYRANSIPNSYDQNQHNNFPTTKPHTLGFRVPNSTMGGFSNDPDPRPRVPTMSMQQRDPYANASALSVRAKSGTPVLYQNRGPKIAPTINYTQQQPQQPKFFVSSGLKVRKEFSADPDSNNNDSQPRMLKVRAQSSNNNKPRLALMPPTVPQSSASYSRPASPQMFIHNPNNGYPSESRSNSPRVSVGSTNSSKGGIPFSSKPLRIAPNVSRITPSSPPKIAYKNNDYDYENNEEDPYYDDDDDEFYDEYDQVSPANSRSANASPTLQKSNIDQQTQTDMKKLQVKQARSDRKIMDLEISNTSLLKVNKYLEKKLRSQSKHIQQAKLLQKRDKILMFPRLGELNSNEEPLDLFSSSASDAEEDDDDDDEESSMTDDERVSPENQTREEKELSEKTKLVEKKIQSHIEFLESSERVNKMIRNCIFISDALITQASQTLDYEVDPSEIKFGGQVADNSFIDTISDVDNLRNFEEEEEDLEKDNTFDSSERQTSDEEIDPNERDIQDEFAEFLPLEVMEEIEREIDQLIFDENQEEPEAEEEENSFQGSMSSQEFNSDRNQSKNDDNNTNLSNKDGLNYGANTDEQHEEDNKDEIGQYDHPNFKDVISRSSPISTIAEEDEEEEEEEKNFNNQQTNITTRKSNSNRASTPNSTSRADEQQEIIRSITPNTTRSATINNSNKTNNDDTPKKTSEKKLNNQLNEEDEKEEEEDDGNENSSLFSNFNSTAGTSSSSYSIFSSTITAEAQSSPGKSPKASTSSTSTLIEPQQQQEQSIGSSLSSLKNKEQFIEANTSTFSID